MVAAKKATAIIAVAMVGIVVTAAVVYGVAAMVIHLGILEV